MIKIVVLVLVVLYSLAGAVMAADLTAPDTAHVGSPASASTFNI
ncbi:MAG: hypothetical protein WB816_19185 [Methylocystis sp.]